MYAWIVTEDHLEHQQVEIFGPGGISAGEVEQLRSGSGSVFRIYDDDGNLYYTGRGLGVPDEEAMLAPLRDYGFPNAGATRIEWQDFPDFASSSWEGSR